MREKVEASLAQVRPALLADGGDVQLVDMNEGVVTVSLTALGMYSALSLSLSCTENY